MTHYKYLSGENFLLMLPYNVTFELCRNRVFYGKYFTHFTSLWAAIDENFYNSTPFKIELTNEYTTFIKLIR